MTIPALRLLLHLANVRMARGKAYAWNLPAVTGINAHTIYGVVQRCRKEGWIEVRRETEAERLGPDGRPATRPLRTYLGITDTGLDAIREEMRYLTLDGVPQ